MTAAAVSLMLDHCAECSLLAMEADLRTLKTWNCVSFGEHAMKVFDTVIAEMLRLGCQHD